MAESDLEAKIAALAKEVSRLAGLASTELDRHHPIGQIIETDSASFNPATAWGGTWAQIKDVFLLAAGDTYAGGATGGAATHTLTIDEMPSHRHGDHMNVEALASVGSTWPTNTSSFSQYTDYTGGGGAHNNMPPYVAVYMWKRTA